MASPHVAGAAALLKQRHRSWTVAQIKSALVLTGTPVFTSTNRTSEVPSSREGGGLINLPRADDPLIFSAPTGLSFGLLRQGSPQSRTLTLTDAGGGAGQWRVAVDQRQGQAAPSGLPHRFRYPAASRSPPVPPPHRTRRSPASSS